MPTAKAGAECRVPVPSPPCQHGGRRGQWGQARLVGACEANGGRKPPGQIASQQVAATERHKREGRKADTEGVVLGVSIHAVLTQKGGPKKPEEPQQLHPERELKTVPMPKPKPKPNPSPKLNLAPAQRPTPTLAPSATLTPQGADAPVPTPTRLRETVSLRNQKKLARAAPALTTGSSTEDRCRI
jgi:hypothetical protein